MRVNLLVILVITALISITDSSRVWTIAIGHGWGSHEYFDDKGYLQGFGLGLIDLVCTAGEMDCRVMWAKYTTCWQSGAQGQHPHGGVGLMGKWYDACTGWVPTVERIHTFTFSLPWINQHSSYFYVYKGSNVDNFDSSDLRGKKIAFLDGWAANEQCVARQTSITGSVLNPEQIIHYAYPNIAVEALRTGKVHAVFSAEDSWSTEQEDSLERVAGQPISCYLGGNGMMTRKNSDFIASWNVGFRNLQSSNKFNQFCEAENKKHAHKGTVDCIKQRW